MGFKQTETHRYGKGSYHQIGLVRGQFGNVPMDKWVKFLQDVGFDGWEEASWELDLGRCDTDAGAEAYARERVDLAKKHGLEIFTVATHLQGQALGDEPSAKTLQFIGGDALRSEAYARERVDLAKKHGLEIFTVATHLQGQALGDEPSAKTLQSIGGDAL